MSDAMKRMRERSARPALGSALAALVAIVVALGCVTEPGRTIGSDALAAAPPRSDTGPVTTASRLLARPRKLTIDLKSALELAGGRAPEVQLALVEQEQADNVVEQRAFGMMPHLWPIFRAFSHRGQAQTQAARNVNVDRQNFELQTLVPFHWRPGVVFFDVLAGLRREDEARAHSETARLDALVAAAQGYLELVRAHARVAIATQALAFGDEVLRRSESVLAKGAGVRIDVLRARAERASRRQDLTDAEGQVAVASARLVSVLDLEPDIELVPHEVYPIPLSIFVDDPDVQELIAHAMQARPELTELEGELAAREHEREGAIYGPMVPFVGAPVPNIVAYPPIMPQTRGWGPGAPWNYGQFYGPDTPFGDTGRTGLFGPTLGNLSFSQDWMIYAGVKLGREGIGDLPEIQRRGLRVQETHLQAQKLRARIQEEVSRAHAFVVATREELDSAREGIVAAAESVRLSRDRLEKGVAIQLEVLDAEDALVRAQSNAVEAAVDFDVAQFRLLRATGTFPHP